jgi:hypothetical protein
MNWDHREPTLDEMLSDSIIRAVMAADGVDPQELAVMLRQIGWSLVRPDQALHVRVPLTVRRTSQNNI